MCFDFKIRTTTLGAGIPNGFGIPMVALRSVFQWCLVFQQCSVLNKMAAILSKTIGNRNKMVAIFSDFQWFVFKMVGTIAIAIAITDHSKTEPLEIRTSKRLVF